MSASNPDVVTVIPAFEGLDNFRDYGGYATASGRRLKRGKLYRSAHHARATDPDLAALAALELSTIVDLRRTDERSRDPSRRHDAFAATVIENDIEQANEDGYHRMLETSDLSVEALRDYLVGYYEAAPFEPRHIDLYSRYFRALAEADGPVLIHCAAGKDRTGILAALTHHLLGVAYEDAVADYLLTNDPANIDRRLNLYGDYVKALRGVRPSDDFLRATLGVEVLYLKTAFDAIKARYGTIDAYLEQALGVDAALKAQIEHRLLD